MKQLTKKFIATWYINIENVYSNDVLSYMETVKATLNMSRLQEMLGEDNVVTFFIPIRTGQTKLEVITLDLGAPSTSDKKRKNSDR